MAVLTCTKCHVCKPIQEFPRNRTKKSGYNTSCKHCASARERARRQENPDYVRGRQRARYASDPDTYRTAQRNSRAKDPERFRRRSRQYLQRNNATINAQRRALYRANPARYNEATKRSYQAHREERIAKQLVYRQEHLEEVKAKDRRRYANKTAEIRAVSRKHYQQNKAQYFANNQRRRARKRAVLRNDFTAAQWRAMVIACDHRCVYCHRHMTRLTQDHLTPLSKGGGHTLWNILPACTTCNSRKRTGAVLCPVQPFLLLP